ncbi:cytosine permease [Natronincola ferrireducens]|uniref:Cytosine permease n=1 Tax=Natronincola ferrireducens TaxID=393762 RepID=A0A1G9FUW0_9FIRM|nr:cytosine permease [Natronincola ferrireducens]SDK92168.1 cytosine permease [Natronincola ferrireducens]
MTNKCQDHDYALQTVPQEGKKGFLSMFAIMLGFTFFSASMWTGGTLGTSLNIKTFIGAVLLGNLILGIYTSSLAYIASKTGLSTHLLARYSFGEKGSYLVSFLLGITQVGWFGVGVAMFALPVEKVTGINVHLLIFLAGILMTATAYFGIKTLMILSIIAVPSIASLGGYSVWQAVESVGGINELLAIEPKEVMGLATALTLCIGSFISGGTLTPDFTRFAKNTKVGVLTTGVAFFMGNSLMFIFGAIGAAVTGQADISEVMFIQGLILPAIIILGFNIWTTNDNALYASGLGFSNITKIAKNKIVIVNGLIGTAGAMFLYNNFVGWLTFLGSFIPSIGGIIIADYFFVNREKYDTFEEEGFETVNKYAIGAWVLGVLAARFVPGIPPLNAVVVSALGYIAITKLTKANTVKDTKVEINTATGN